MDAPALPYSEEAEQSVLGSMLLDRATVARVVEQLRPEDFYRNANRRIFEALAELHARGEPADLVTVTDRLRETGRLDEAGGAGYVTKLLALMPTAANVEHHARIVLGDGMKRELAEAFGDLQRGALNGHDLVRLLDSTDRTTAAVRERLDSFAPSPLRGVPWEKRILTAAEVSAADVTQTWVPFWGQEGLIGQGLVTLLSGHSKVAGKSTAVAAGLHRLLRPAPETRVLVLTEEPPSVWKRRIESWGFVPGGLAFRFADGTPWTALLRQAEQLGSEVMVVDTLRSFAGVEDENDASRVVQAVQPLVFFARRRRTAVLANHHLRKADAEGLGHAGSTALVALCDIACELRAESKHAPNRRTLRTVSRFEETPRSLLLELSGNEIVVLGTPAAVSLTEVAARIESLLLPDAPRTTKEVRDALGDPRPSEEQTRQALALLLAEDKVARDGSGKKGSPHRWSRISIPPTTPSSGGRNESGVSA
jgi:hypothetical protein